MITIWLCSWFSVTDYIIIYSLLVCVSHSGCFFFFHIICKIITFCSKNRSKYNNFLHLHVFTKLFGLNFVILILYNVCLKIQLLQCCIQRLQPHSWFFDLDLQTGTHVYILHARKGTNKKKTDFYDYVAFIIRCINNGVDPPIHLIHYQCVKRNNNFTNASLIRFAAIYFHWPVIVFNYIRNDAVVDVL